MHPLEAHRAQFRVGSLVDGAHVGDDRLRQRLRRALAYHEVVAEAGDALDQHPAVRLREERARVPRIHPALRQHRGDRRSDRVLPRHQRERVGPPSPGRELPRDLLDGAGTDPGLRQPRVQPEGERGRASREDLRERNGEAEQVRHEQAVRLVAQQPAPPVRPGDVRSLGAAGKVLLFPHDGVLVPHAAPERVDAPLDPQGRILRKGGAEAVHDLEGVEGRRPGQRRRSGLLYGARRIPGRELEDVAVGDSGHPPVVDVHRLVHDREQPLGGEPAEILEHLRHRLQPVDELAAFRIERLERADVHRILRRGGHDGADGLLDRSKACVRLVAVNPCVPLAQRRIEADELRHVGVTGESVQDLVLVVAKLDGTADAWHGSGERGGVAEGRPGKVRHAAVDAQERRHVGGDRPDRRPLRAPAARLSCTLHPNRVPWMDLRRACDHVKKTLKSRDGPEPVAHGTPAPMTPARRPALRTTSRGAFSRRRDDR